MKILGVDPGTARLGWGIVNDKAGDQIVGEYGLIETKKTLADPSRLKQLFDQFTKLLTSHHPDAVAVEDLFFAKNRTSAIKVAQARGVILVAAELAAIPSFSYTPLQIKQAVTGYGQADKAQVQQMTKAILQLPAIPKPDDTADALAVALTHAFSYKLKSRVK